MADDAKKEAGDAVKAAAGETSGKRSLVILLGMSLGVAALAVGGGFILGKVMAGGGPSSQPTTAATEKPGPDQFVYVDFDPVTVNLNERNLPRYVRVAITLAIKKDNDSEARSMIEKGNPELKSWLTVYLSGCSLEDVRGPKNLNKIRREVEENFNQQLWPAGPSLIDHVLLKEFAVQ